MAYNRLGSNTAGDDDDHELLIRYTRRNRHQAQIPMPEPFAPASALHTSTGDRLRANPSYSIENLAYSYHQNNADAVSYSPAYAPHAAQAPAPTHLDDAQHARSDVKEIALAAGNRLVVDCPVPQRLFDQLTLEQQQLREFRFMQYSAATCGPELYNGHGFQLRQRMYTVPREVELFIVVTMYNEEEDLLARTLIGVFENINAMEGMNDSPVWGAGSWRKIVVCIVSDGVAAINKRSLAALAGLGVYQKGLNIDLVNGKAVKAHIYEYTTQMELGFRDKRVEVQRGSVPVQLLFCLKQENKQKINSHRWFFQAFSECVNPKYCVLLDAGTKPGKKSIFRLWSAFAADPRCAGACGEIKAMKGKMFRNLLNPLVATQNFEYKMSNILDKPLESAFGFISVLPGAFSAYRWTALQGEPLRKYFLGEKMHNNSNFFTANMYLAEDRILCYELVAKKNERWLLRYVKGSTGETDVPDGIAEFISQRRRWLNGSFFAALYTVVHFWKLWSSGHSFLRKVMFTVEIMYQIVSMLFAWFALGNFFLVFRILTRSLSDPDLLGTTGGIVSVIFEWMYLISLIACFILALGNKPKRSRRIYVSMVLYWAVVMAYLIFASIFMTVRSVQAELKEGFHVRDLFQNSIFSTLIVSMASTYALWFIISFMFLEPAHMFTSFVQYLLMTPTYINVLNVFAFCNTDDLSWGTKEMNKKPASAVEAGKDNTVSIRVAPPDAQYDREMALLAAPDGAKALNDEDTREEANEEKKAYYASVRSGIVMAWIFTNLGLCTVVLQTGSIQVFSKSGEDPTKKVDTARIYLSVVLWSVAWLSLFRFVGSLWFLLRRMFAGV